MSWNEHSEMIDLKLDIAGDYHFAGLFVICNLQNAIIEDIVHMHHISSISLAVLSGTMLGHAVALRKKIWKLYKMNQPQTDFSNKNKTRESMKLIILATLLIGILSTTVYARNTTPPPYTRSLSLFSI